MSETKLLPCPFCGVEAKIATYDWGYSVKEYWIYCHSCDCASGRYHSKEEAIEAWNTRKPMDDIVEQMKKAKGYYGYYGSEECEYVPYETAIDIVRNAGKGGAV